MVIGHPKSRDEPFDVGIGVASPRLWKIPREDHTFDTTFRTRMLMMCVLAMQLEITLNHIGERVLRLLSSLPKLCQSCYDTFTQFGLFSSTMLIALAQVDLRSCSVPIRRSKKSSLFVVVDVVVRELLQP